MAKKPTHKQRAINKLEALGWTVADVEKWIPQARRRIDMFNLLDIVAIREGQTLGLQVTSASGGNVAAHREKMLDEPRLVDCLRAGWLIELWGVRNKSTRDRSFAVVRKFQLINDGRQVAVYRTSSVLAM